MKKLLLVLPLLWACTAQNPEVDQFADIALDGKDDSAAKPTFMGSLYFDQPQEAQLRPLTSGYHTYNLFLRKGWNIRILLRSTDFKTYLRITGPDFERRYKWTDKGDVALPDDGSYLALLDIFDIPEDGEYQILATSISNMSLFPFAKSWGHYTLAAETDIECALDDDAACPPAMKCLRHARDRAGFGTCERDDACYRSTDCGPSPSIFCSAPPSCEGARPEVAGRCDYHCRI